MHNSMVEVTCKPDSAQYFLITPKLLPDLEYHERMKILCVNNGELPTVSYEMLSSWTSRSREKSAPNATSLSTFVCHELFFQYSFLFFDAIVRRQ